MTNDTIVRCITALTILSLIATACVFLVPSSSASSYQTYDGNIYTYTTSGNGTSSPYEATITNYGGTEDYLVIQAALEGYPVVHIGASAFNGNRNVEAVIIPQNVKTVGDYAFANCTNLKAAYFTGVMPEIGTGAFDGTASDFKIFYIDDSWQSYSGHSIQKWDIKEYADSSGGRYSYYVFDGEITVFRYISGENISIPSHIDGIKVVSIGPESFYMSEVKTVTIASGVENIGERAFSWNHKSGSPLYSVSLPNSITSIEDEAFRDCKSLKSIDLPNSLRFIGFEAFRDTALTSVSIPRSVHTMSEGAFYCCYDLTKVTISNETELDILNDRVFGFCENLNSINIPDEIDYIGAFAFTNCKSLKTICLDDVERIGSSAFYACTSLTNLYMDDAASIGNAAFSGCTSLKSVELDNIEYIGDRAFSSCTSLGYVVLSDDLKEIGSDAFRGCNSLSAAYFEGRLPVIGENAFYRTADNFQIYYLNSNSNSWSGYNDYPSDTWNGVVPGENKPSTYLAIVCVAIVAAAVIAVAVLVFSRKRK